jgi:hypothetical protein
MSVCQMSVGLMSFTQISLGQMSAGQMSVGQMSVGQMAFDKKASSPPKHRIPILILILICCYSWHSGNLTKFFWRHDFCCHDNFPKRHRTDPPRKVGNVSCQDKGTSPTFFCVTVALQISGSAIVKLSVTAALWRGVTVTPLQWSYASLRHCVSEVLRHIKLCVTTAVWRFIVASQWHFVIASLRHCHALILRHSVTFALHQLLNKLIIVWTLKQFLTFSKKNNFFQFFFNLAAVMELSLYGSFVVQETYSQCLKTFFSCRPESKLECCSCTLFQPSLIFGSKARSLKKINSNTGFTWKL